MEQITFLSIGTVLAFIAFMSVCYWVYFAHKESDFDEAAQLPFLDDMEVDSTQAKELIEQAVETDTEAVEVVDKVKENNL